MKKFHRFFEDMRGYAIRVKEHMNRFGPAFTKLEQRPGLEDRDGHLLVLYLRAQGWIQSLAKMDKAADLQAIACCCRSCLEIAVDVLTLAADPTNESGLKMRWWDLSAQYQMAKTYVKFNEELGAAIKSPDVAAARDFCQRNESFVMSLRSSLWTPRKDKKGNLQHPPRWTDNADIKAEVHAADKGPFADLIKENMGSNLLKYYVSEYQNLNKTIHGSGKLGVQGGARLISVRAAAGLRAGASLAMLCHQAVFTDRGLDKAIPNLTSEWEHIRMVHNVSFIYHVHETDDEDLNGPDAS